MKRPYSIFLLTRPPNCLEVTVGSLRKCCTRRKADGATASNRRWSCNLLRNQSKLRDVGGCWVWAVAPSALLQVHRLMNQSHCTEDATKSIGPPPGRILVVGP